MSSLRISILCLCLVLIMSSVKCNAFNQGRHLKSSVVNASLQTPKISSISDNRNFRTETLQNATKFKRETSCGIGESQCPYRNEKTGQYTCFRSCQRCDGVVDCPRATDEEGCPCRSRIASRYICDGSPDCSDFSDELGCGECMQDELHCGDNCVSITDFCTKKSCPQISRSLFCSRLNLNPFDNSDETSYRSEGYLQMRVRNKWLPVCGTLSLQSQVVVNQYCSEVTGVRDAKHSFQLEELPTKPSLWSELLVTEDFVFASQAESCIQNMVIHVNCALPKCQNKREIYEQTTHHKIIERIVGGNDAIEGDWRFLVRIIKNGEHNCGGSILTSRWILSASHCFLKISGETYEVESGSGRTGIYGPNVQKRLVSHVIRHEDFDPYSMANDVALLRLLTPLQFNRWTRPTCFLDNTILIQENSTCFLAGWGYQTEEGNLAENLQEISIPILDEEKCIKEFYYVDPQKVICAGHKKGKKDSCQGDSGGPMMCNLCNTRDNLQNCEDEGWAQAAIVSYGRGCARPGVPGVYTKVEYFKDWILDTFASMENGSVKLPEIVPKTICDGLQCFHAEGLCLNSSKICDNKVDCLNAEDELNCKDRITDSLPFNSSNSINDNSNNNSNNNGNNNNDNNNNNEDDNNNNNKDKFDYDYRDENEIEIKNVSTSCPENHYQCEIIPGCIPNSLLCDETRNCRDGTDELRCTCVDRIYLTNRNKICDGFYDCPDFSDEFCDLCKDGKWLCRRSFQCISRDKICDSVPDCRYGEDELNCLALTPNEGELVLDREGNPKYSDHGIILLYSSSSSSWDPICEHELDQNIASEICTYLGFSSPLSIKYNANLPSTYKIRQESARKKRFISFPHPRHDFRSSGRGLTVNGVQLENFKGAKEEEEEEKEDEESLAADFGNVFPHRKMIGNSKTGRTRRMACNQVKLECGERICGKVQSLHFSNAPPLADASHVPWAVGIYKSGKYLCGGTIVDLQWVLSFRHCLNNISLLRDEIHVLGGSSRGLSTTPFMGPNEIDIRIDFIVEVDKEEDLILLHLEKSISLFESLSATCWDDRSNIIWKECLVVGPYKGNLNHAFLLSPKEDCEENKLCFENDIPFDQICSDSWSGLITCREERKSNSPWTAVAIKDFRYDRNCSDLKSFKIISQDLRKKIQRKMVEPIQSRSPLQCDTHKCPLGICIPTNEMCNAKIACPDMSDEPFECPVPVTVCTYFNSTSCECPHDDFKCSDGLCIESVKICDGVAHCANGDDEKNCTCSVILTSLKEKSNCNGIIDCGDESDELHCGCDMEKEFRCFRSAKQECISRLVVCDAVPDCSSGEDEAFCLTISSTFFPEENALGIPSSSSKGYLLLRIKGKWYTYANQIWTATNSEAVCKSLGYKDVLKTEQKLINPSLFKARAQEILPVLNTSQNEIVIYIDCIV